MLQPDFTLSSDVHLSDHLPAIDEQNQRTPMFTWNTIFCSSGLSLAPRPPRLTALVAASRIAPAVWRLGGQQPMHGRTMRMHETAGECSPVHSYSMKGCTSQRKTERTAQSAKPTPIRYYDLHRSLDRPSSSTLLCLLNLGDLSTPDLALHNLTGKCTITLAKWSSLPTLTAGHLVTVTTPPSSFHSTGLLPCMPSV